MRRPCFLVIGLFVLLGPCRISLGAEQNLASLERSFWVHASLADVPARGYWGTDFPGSNRPTEKDVQNAAKMFAGVYAANKLYLVYHREISIGEAEETFRFWRQYCPKDVQIVPTLVLKMYDKSQTQVFSDEELRELVEFFKHTINADHLAIFDVYENRDQGLSLKYLCEQYPKGLVRVGIQPSEIVKRPFVSAVQDTWNGFCHGKTEKEWREPNCGANLLRQWVEDRNQERVRVAWDLIVVAWDYSVNDRGSYPGYDDASKNMPLPAKRNTLALEEIMKTAHADCLNGFSSDLLIFQANSINQARDGVDASFYRSLKKGEAYHGYFAAPFQEIVTIYGKLRDGKMP